MWSWPFSRLSPVVIGVLRHVANSTFKMFLQRMNKAARVIFLYKRPGPSGSRTLPENNTRREKAQALTEHLGRQQSGQPSNHSEIYRSIPLHSFCILAAKNKQYCARKAL